MATRLRPVGHEDRLSLVEHLDELRTRLIYCVITVTIVLGICFWQNHALLDVINRPLVHATQKSKGQGLDQAAREQSAVRRYITSSIAFDQALLQSPSVRDPALRARLRANLAQQRAALAAIPKGSAGRQPVTLGVGEPFSQTLKVALYFALLISMPLLLYQLYAFVLPAFSPEERRVAVPFMAMVPVLFIMGVAFGYYLVLPKAVQFLQNFNSSSFDVLVQARDYYQFAILTLLALGILFQIPVGILALTRLGVVSVEQLRKNRRYAIVLIAVVAMLLPGTDPVTTLIEMVPMVLLYELSILLAARFARARPAGADEDEPPAFDFDQIDQD